MATKCPHAIWDPLGPQTEPALTHHDIVCLHTMAGPFSVVHDMFHANGYYGTESHFGIRGDGYAEQWQDLEFQADANWDGNDRVISIETADMGEDFPAWTSPNVPEWTNEQLDKIVLIVTWLCDRYGIPKQLIPDSKQGRRGIGYHRQGIPGNFPPPYTGIVSGGEMWTNPKTGFGKPCPGDKRITQLINIVIPRVQTVNIPGMEEDEMATMVRRRSDGYTFIHASGKNIKVTGPDNWAGAEGNMPHIILDDDEYNRWASAFPFVN